MSRGDFTGRRGFIANALGAAAGIGLLGSAAGQPQRSAGARQPSEVVAPTAYGRIRGVRSADGVITFRGVPYAGPTGGRNRFLPPTPPRPWTGVRDAFEWGPISPQLASGSRAETQMFLGGPTEGRQGEDCLVLNVWTKSLSGPKRPVYVRIHGGGFTTGSGNRPLYLGHNTVRLNDVVYVSMNHRLDCVGYLDLSRFAGAEYASSGNAGMLDLIAALRWVRDNIEVFGGDPSRVMIVGESGGGFKVSTLLGMPPARGLFHRAVIESGPGLAVRTPDQAAELTDRFLRRLGLGRNNFAELQALPLHRLLEASALTLTRRWYPEETPPRTGWRPVLDGATIPQHMFEPAATPLSADVPVIIGYNRDEGTFTRQQDELLYALDDAGLRDRVRALAGEAADRVVSVYRRRHPGASNTELMVQIGTDTSFGANSIKLAERKVALRRAPVYLYRFDWQSPAFNGRYGATHGLEIPFTAYNVSELPVMTHNRPDAHALAQKVTATWVQFAATGVPNGAGLPSWAAYTPDRRATLLIDNESRLVEDPMGDEARRLWAEVLPPPLL